MPKFYVEFEEKTKWFGHVEAETLDEATEIAKNMCPTCLNSMIKMHSPVSSVMIQADFEHDIIENIYQLLL